MTKAELIERIRRGREEWDALLARFDDVQWLQPDATGGWTLKDIVAHITWHEREMANVLEAHALVGSDLWSLPLQERNQAIYVLNRSRSLEDVRDEAQQVFSRLLAGLANLSEEDLHEPRRFADMPEEWQPWELLADNTYEHYADHLEQARAML